MNEFTRMVSNTAVKLFWGFLDCMFYREIEGSLVYLLFKKFYSDVLDFHLNVCLLTCPMQDTAI